MKTVIFEGMDRTGKDTQISLLKKHFAPIPYHTIHYSKIKFSSIEEYVFYSTNLYKEMFNFIEENKDKYGLIFNRSHIGESVYSPIYRNYFGNYIYDIEKLISNKSNILNEIYLIILVGNSEILSQRDDGDSLSKNDNSLIDKEYELFTDAYKKTLIKNKIIIDISNKSIEEVNKEIIKFIDGNNK